MTVAISAPTVSLTATAYAPSVDVPVVSAFHKLIYRDALESTFFNIANFAETISYYHSTLGTWASYNVLFDDPHASVNLAGENEFNSIRPQIQIIEAKLQHRILKGDRIRRRGKKYLVEDFMSDGVGVSTVYLRIK